MSQQLINLNPDLQRLRTEGFDVSIETGGTHLVLRNVPYVTSEGRVARGALISTLSLSGNKTNPPDSHTVMFAGEYPHDHRGKPIDAIRNSELLRDLGGDLKVKHQFSSKPKAGYVDYFEKMSTYANILSAPAAHLEPGATPRTYEIHEAEDDSPFVYLDNASGRAGISEITAKLSRRSVAIIGLGGTGSYLLDLLAKTPVGLIEIFDDDIFEQHSAFRAPGAPSLETLQKRPKKVEYFNSIYRHMHKRIVPRATRITSENANELQRFEMVFICVDNAKSRATIVDALERNMVTFIDVGIGVEAVDGQLIGTLRTTTSTPTFRDHVRQRNRIPVHSAEDEDLYGTNIQIAELNSLNACLAVIKWKKLCGFYHDTENEHFSLFQVDGNHLLNEDTA